MGRADDARRNRQSGLISLLRRPAGAASLTASPCNPLCCSALSADPEDALRLDLMLRF